MSRSRFMIVLSAALAGCGGAPAPAGTPSSAPPADQQATNVDALIADLDRSERDLQAQLGSDDAASGPASTAAPGAAEPSKAPEPEKPQPTTPAEGEAQAAPPPSPCDAACRALASMQRSAQRICELTSDGDSRCNGARSRVSRAQARCGRAGCECRA